MTSLSRKSSAVFACSHRSGGRGVSDGSGGIHMRRISAVGTLAVLLLSVGALRADQRPRPAEGADPADKPPTREQLTKTWEQEKNKYLERLQFCTKLRGIAAATRDDELERKALMLEKLAEEVYLKKMGKLPAKMEEAKAAEAALESKRNWSPSGTASTSGSTPARAPNGRLLNRGE
jgi:hypothetical protein